MARLRKAAFVLASLPREEAQAILARLPAEHLEAVVSEIAMLGAVWGPERQEAMAEFAEAWHEVWREREYGPWSMGSHDSRSPEWSSRRSRDGRAAGGHGGTIESAGSQSEARGSSDAPFAGLAKLPFCDAAARLEMERPQVVASVIAQLPQQVAMGVLAELPSELQRDVIRRMATLEPISPEIAADLRDAVEAAVGWDGERELRATRQASASSDSNSDSEKQADAELSTTTRPPTLAATAG